MVTVRQKEPTRARVRLGRRWRISATARGSEDSRETTKRIIDKGLNIRYGRISGCFILFSHTGDELLLGKTVLGAALRANFARCACCADLYYRAAGVCPAEFSACGGRSDS